MLSRSEQKFEEKLTAIEQDIHKKGGTKKKIKYGNKELTKINKKICCVPLM